MGKYSGFIILALVLIKIVASILQAARKQQERQRAMEAAKRRAMEQAGGVAGPVIVARESQPSPPIGRLPDRQDDLEARRRAQLEQLRQRREGRRMGTAMPQGTMPRPGSLTQAPPVAQRRTTIAPPIGSSDKARSQAQEVERRERVQDRERRDQGRRLAEERQHIAEDRSRRERAARERREVAQQAKAPPSAVGAVIGRPAALADRLGGLAAAVAGQLHQPSTLRDLIILREVLDRPVALRNPAE